MKFDLFVFSAVLLLLSVLLERAAGQAAPVPANLCVMANASSIRCCSVPDGVDRVDAPLMRYCADIGCAPNPNVTRVANSSYVLQFSNAIIGQGVFEERAARASFVLPQSRGSPAPRNLSEALIQCEASALRKACLFVDPADFSVSADGVCSACLSVANWHIYADSKPVLAPERFVISCFKVARKGWVPPVLITPMPSPPPLGPTPPFTIPPAPDGGDPPASEVPASTAAAGDSGEPSIGLIAGAAAGGAVALFVLVVGGLLLCRKRGASAAASTPGTTSVANPHYDAPPIHMIQDTSAMDSARSSLGVSVPAAPMSRTNYSAFDEADDVRDKDPRAQGNDAQQRTAEQQRQIEDIRRRQQQQQQQNK